MTPNRAPSPSSPQSWKHMRDKKGGSMGLLEITPEGYRRVVPAPEGQDDWVWITGERAGPPPPKRFGTFPAADALGVVAAGDAEPTKKGEVSGKGWREAEAKQKARVDYTNPDQWAAKAFNLMADGHPRTFNAISVALTNRSGKRTMNTSLAKGLWMLVDSGMLERTDTLPIWFQLTHHMGSGRAPFADEIELIEEWVPDEKTRRQVVKLWTGWLADDPKVPAYFLRNVISRAGGEESKKLRTLQKALTTGERPTASGAKRRRKAAAPVKAKAKKLSEKDPSEQSQARAAEAERAVKKARVAKASDRNLERLRAEEKAKAKKPEPKRRKAAKPPKGAGSLLAKLAAEKGISLTELAAAGKVSCSTMSRTVRGQGALEQPKERLAAWAKVLGTSQRRLSSATRRANVGGREPEPEYGFDGYPLRRSLTPAEEHAREREFWREVEEEDARWAEELPWTSTAYGEIKAFKSAPSKERGGTTMWLGYDPRKKRYVVTSRFQYELVTKSLEKAQAAFTRLIDPDDWPHLRPSSATRRANPGDPQRDLSEDRRRNERMSDQEIMASKGYRFTVFLPDKVAGPFGGPQEPLFSKTESQAKEIVSTEGGYYVPFKIDSDGYTVWDLSKYVEFTGYPSDDIGKLDEGYMGDFLHGELQSDQVIEANGVQYTGSDAQDYAGPAVQTSLLHRRANPGGKIIGHTTGGSPIYESKTHHEVHAFSTSRHKGRGPGPRGGGGKTETVYTVHDPTKPGGKSYHEYIGRGDKPTSRRTSAIAQHKKKHGIDKPMKHVDFDKRAAKEAYAARGEAGEGEHQLSEREGVKTVKTHHRAGVYAVHRKGKAEFVVTHTPTGLLLGAGSQALAKRLSEHMHEHAGDAGSDTKFGKLPQGEAHGKMMAAWRKFKKSEDARRRNPQPGESLGRTWESWSGDTEVAVVDPQDSRGADSPVWMGLLSDLLAEGAVDEREKHRISRELSQDGRARFGGLLLVEL